MENMMSLGKNTQIAHAQMDYISESRLMMKKKKTALNTYLTGFFTH